MEELNLLQGVMCEIENTEYGAVVTFPAGLELSDLPEDTDNGFIKTDSGRTLLRYAFQHQKPSEDYESPMSYSGDVAAEGFNVMEAVVEDRSGTENVVEEVPQDDLEYGGNLDFLEYHENESHGVGEKTTIRESEDGGVVVVEGENAAGASFPELGSIIELESENLADGNDVPSQNNEGSQSTYHGVTRKWNDKKTMDLIKLIRKSQNLFRNGGMNRIVIWSEISEEMSCKGHDHCSRDDCRKKWDNLYRTYKRIQQRDGRDNTWELYAAVKETVINLDWENSRKGKRNLTNFNEHDAEKLTKLTEEFHCIYKGLCEDFKTKANDLDEEKDTIVSKITTLVNQNSF